MRGGYVHIYFDLAILCDVLVLGDLIVIVENAQRKLAVVGVMLPTDLR